ncbi:MAG: hypothetical protein GAK45_00994 [Pseudomonas citronellolis]|nr:MAG: hypothetical protein GAK45_00994 [Pseudomonas citronellolis]
MPWQRPIHHELQLQPRPGHEAELGALLDRLIDDARAHPGCLDCRLALEPGHPWRLEGHWQHEDALLAFFETPARQLLGDHLLHHCRSLCGGILDDSSQATVAVA